MHGGPDHVKPRRPFDPILTNALRYTISANEYEHLHKYLSSRARVVQERAPQPQRFESTIPHTEDYTVATIRASVRLLILTYGGFKTWDLLARRFFPPTPKSTRRASNANVRTAASFSLILLFHRLLRRFLLRLRISLQQDSDKANGFRTRNPNISALLTSKYTVSIGAAIAGLFLGVTPRSQLRITIAIYAVTRSIEFAYNAAETKGLIWGRNGRPSWVGSWMMVPFAYGQLLHAFVFDRDCFPSGGTFGQFILSNSPGYIQTRPTDLPTSQPWPTTFEIVDALAGLSTSSWPSLAALTDMANPIPRAAALVKVAPIIAPAHPLITQTSCAILHPSDPSCVRTQAKYFLASLPRTARFFGTIYGALALLSLRPSSLTSASRSKILHWLNRLSARILRLSLFVTGAIGTSWSSICLLGHMLPNNFLATQRWFLGGFLGGLWAFVAREHEKGQFLNTVRLSLASLWKVGVKRRWWTGVANGDVLLFCWALGVVNLAYEAEPGSVRGGIVRKGLGVFRGEGWVDRIASGSRDEVRNQGIAGGPVSSHGHEGLDQLVSEGKKEL